MQGVWIQPLVGVLRFHMPPMPKNQKTSNRSNAVTNSIKTLKPSTSNNKNKNFLRKRTHTRVFLGSKNLALSLPRWTFVPLAPGNIRAAHPPEHSKPSTGQLPTAPLCPKGGWQGEVDLFLKLLSAIPSELQVLLLDHLPEFPHHFKRLHVVF